ncbi:hypothetical protein F53441_5138 [Fusarium austroafricanum]|uniref:Uncharacterized protein n=1 Tax=Fusarium austroafricanum TaxID=2364996 RepID=A0A8H4KLL6_9HYPO|nr:hypothetical protein F53441_5138 [Fusarium austroafricanum]
MANKRSSRKSVGFLDALGQWTLGPSSNRRSPNCRRYPRSTKESREERLKNAPPGLNLTAAEWRRYASVHPKGQDECNCSECDGEDEPKVQAAPEPRSGWSHSASSAVTRAPEAVKRDSGFNRLVGRTHVDVSEPRLRHQFSYDGNNDALFANIPRQEQRGAGEIVIHRQHEGQDGLEIETFGQNDSGYAPSAHSLPVHERGDVKSVPESQFFNNPRPAPNPRDQWPVRGAANLQEVPWPERESRIAHWRDSITGEEYTPGGSVAGGSEAPTLWPGPRSAASVAPDDSLTEVMMRRQYSHKSRAGGSRSGGSKSGSKHSRRH